MQTLFIGLVIVSLIVTVGFLLSGVIGMLQGADFNKRYGNLMMRGRVASQAVTVLLIIAYVLLFGTS
ncbi:MAG: twin transmembrane helix small protein [Alphaproteobacteria bacterium]|nr:twin transmembrane helix small protein [Alphaproteobacteria bacterium]